MLIVPGIVFDPETSIAISTVFERDDYVPGEEFKMIISLSVPGGYHITGGELFYFDTENFPELNSEAILLSGQMLYRDETVFAGDVLYVFEGIFPEEKDRSIYLGYQICNEIEDFCYIPVDRIVNVDFNNIDASMFAYSVLQTVVDTGSGNIEGDYFTFEEKLAGMFRGRSSWSLIVFILAFIGGFLTSLTPCVYPIIPVVISYMGAKSDNKKSAGFFLSLFFVSGLALTYTTIGLLASFFSGVFGIGDFAAHPVIRIFIALVFTILALSMFGFWDMTFLSSENQTGLMNKGKKKKGIAGALFIGMVSGLIAAPCVGPVLAVLLIHVANAGDVLYGGLLFLTFSLGMGILFIVIGTFSGAVSALPGSGVWMIKVKKVFGILMMAAAVYFIKLSIPEPLYFAIVSLLLFMLAGFLGAFSGFNNKNAGIADYLGKSSGLLVLTAAFIFSVKTVSVFTDIPFSSSVYVNPVHKTEGVEFIKTDNDMSIIEKAVEKAHESDKMILVDLWAEWCKNCIELDRRTWSDPKVYNYINEHFIPVKLDFTDNRSPFSRKFIDKYKDYGSSNLPLILFLDKEGRVVDTVVGFLNAERMLNRSSNIYEKYSK